MHSWTSYMHFRQSALVKDVFIKPGEAVTMVILFPAVFIIIWGIQIYRVHISHVVLFTAFRFLTWSEKVRKQFYSCIGMYKQCFRCSFFYIYSTLPFHNTRIFYWLLYTDTVTYSSPKVRRPRLFSSGAVHAADPHPSLLLRCIMNKVFQASW